MSRLNMEVDIDRDEMLMHAYLQPLSAQSGTRFAPIRLNVVYRPTDPLLTAYPGPEYIRLPFSCKLMRKFDISTWTARTALPLVMLNSPSVHGTMTLGIMQAS
jgi:hypothetical protein